MDAGLNGPKLTVCCLLPLSHNITYAGKSYAAWRGHDQDALVAYDTLIGAFPSDFRGYLAKGIFLRDRGRQGDAERMFLQAKFYAPENLQSFIANRAGARTDVGPLPDNGLE